MTSVALLLLLQVGTAGAGADTVRGHFARGQRLFGEERYEEALREFEQASTLSPVEMADFYFNIGQCQRHLGQARRAIAAFERYLELKPDTDDRQQVRGMIARLRARARAEPPLDAATALAPEPPAEPARSETDARVAMTTPVVAAPKEGPVEPPARVVDLHASAGDQAHDGTAQPSASPALDLAAAHSGESSSVPIYRRWWFWTGGVAGLVTVAAIVAVSIHHGGMSSAPPSAATPSMLGSAGTFDTRGGH
jgi:tetratricopeptide (TPR) repeat protein